MNVDMAIDSLTNTDTYGMLAVATLGYHAPMVVRNVVESQVGINAPGEVYGLAVYAGHRAAMGPVPYAMAFNVGALVHSGEQAAERTGVKQTIMGIGR